MLKIIEAMKAIKGLQEKVTDLIEKVKTHSSHLSFETPVYGSNQANQVESWIQGAHDSVAEIARLRQAIQRTNQAVSISIKLPDGNLVTGTLAYWVLRRRELILMDQTIELAIGGKALREGQLPSSTPGIFTQATIVRHYDPARRDTRLAALMAEPKVIDAALEVANATTDLMQ